MAAKARSIPVVEFQHGIITRLHPAYDFPVFKDRTLMPDYLAFYVLEKDIPESFYIDPSRTINIGHAYLEWALSQTKKPAWASSRKVVVVTLQYGYYDSVIKVVEEAAKLATDYYFVIAPRMPHDEVTIASLHNIHIERNLSFFECLPFADFHSTFSSTCTLEAFMTGVPTIVIAIDEIAEKYYRQFPLEGMIEYVSDGKQFANALKRVVPDSKKHKHVDHLKGIQNLLFCLEAKLRRAEISDARFIYDLRFSPDVVAVSMTTDIPSYENHLRWFTDNFNSPNRDFFIVTHDGKNIGVIRYDWDTHTSAFVSIFFSPECRGKGLGKIALSLGEEKLKSSGKNGVIKAVVKDDNTQSLQMFLNAGYVRSGEHLGKTIT
ncbi:MAG: GNAT family N-acetyltransferase [Bdellovibrionota bacterium]